MQVREFLDRRLNDAAVQKQPEKERKEFPLRREKDASQAYREFRYRYSMIFKRPTWNPIEVHGGETL